MGNDHARCKYVAINIDSSDTITISGSVAGAIPGQAPQGELVFGPSSASLGGYLVKLPPVLPTQFYVANDSARDRTYQYSASGELTVDHFSFSTANTAPRGAASTAAGDKLWVVDANKTVYVYSASGALLGSWAAGGLTSRSQIEGITTNGTDIWLVDAQQDKVLKYTGAASRLSGTQTVASSFKLNSANRNAKDLVTDGSSIWVVNDASTDKVFKYSLAGALVGSWCYVGRRCANRCAVFYIACLQLFVACGSLTRFF